MKDIIYRQDAIDALGDIHPLDYNAKAYKARIEKLPSAEPILYGYRIEILATIAAIMAKENVSPETAVEYFMNINTIVQIIRNQEKELLDRALRRALGQEA